MCTIYVYLITLLTYIIEHMNTSNTYMKTVYLHRGPLQTSIYKFNLININVCCSGRNFKSGSKVLSMVSDVALAVAVGFLLINSIIFPFSLKIYYHRQTSVTM